MEFEIDLTTDLEHYVVIVNTTGETDGWNDLSKPFNTLIEAMEWAGHIKDKYPVRVSVEEKGE